MTELELELWRRYEAASHAMQSGVAAMLALGHDQANPKHLRTGVNAAMVEHGAMVELLIAKGVFSREEFFSALADKMEAEARSYEKRLKELTGKDIKLA